MKIPTLPAERTGDAVPVPLSNGTTALIDPADAPRVLAYRWHDNGLGYAYSDSGDRRVYLARLILDPPPGRDAGHRNGNPRDYRRANLYPATRVETSRTARLRSDNTSGYRGVVWAKERNRWRARIKVHGRRPTLGQFQTAEAAALAYDDAARQYYGNLASLNFPKPGERGVRR